MEDMPFLQLKERTQQLPDGFKVSLVAELLVSSFDYSMLNELMLIIDSDTAKTIFDSLCSRFNTIEEQEDELFSPTS